MPFTTVLISKRPTIDRIAAFHMMEKALRRSLDIQFSDHTITLSDEELLFLAEKGTLTIGVGQGRTYRQREMSGKKYGSETAIIIYELSMLSPSYIFYNDRVLKNFIQMMDRNNNDGYLRRQPYSINWIVIQAYRLGHDSSEKNFMFTDQDVVRLGVHVIKVYLECLSLREFDLSSREQVMQTPAMSLLPKKARGHQGPMTVSRYIRDMFMLGESENEIYKRADWFIRVHDRANERQKRADRVAQSQEFSQFIIGSSGNICVWIESDDPYLLWSLAKHYDLVVLRSSNGNIIMASRLYDLSMVANTFMSAEPGLWYHEPDNLTILANGTESVEAQPTNFSRQEIEEAIAYFAKIKKI